MTTKQYLSQYRDLNKEIDSLCEEIQQLRCFSTRTSLGNISNMPRAVKNSTEASFVNIVEKIIPLDDLASKKQDEIYDMKIYLNKVINLIKVSRLRKLLRLTYMSKKEFTWAQIAKYINTTPDMARKKLHQQAIKIFTQYIVLPIDR